MPRVPIDWPPSLYYLLAIWHRGGWIGVDLFFVLSGFLVAGLLFAEYKKFGSLNWFRFFARRGWKIYPPFYVLLLVSFLLYLHGGQGGRTRQLVGEALFLQNYIGALWNHTWSLAVEEHFYLLLPILLLTLLKLRRTSLNPLATIPWIALTVLGGCLILRVANALTRNEYSHFTHLFPTHLRLDSLFVGVALSYYFHFHAERFAAFAKRFRVGLLALGAASLAPALLLPLEGSPFIYTGGLTLFALGSAMLLVGALAISTKPSVVTIALGTLGSYSYSIYLWHMPVRNWGIPALEKILGAHLPYALQHVVYIVGALGAGVLMAKAIEMPSLRLRERYLPSRSQQPSYQIGDPRMERAVD